MMNQRLGFASLMIVLLFSVTACSGAPVAEGADVADEQVGSPAAGEPTLEELRALTERFRDVNVALAEGFIRDPSDMCVTAEMEGLPAEDGAMGIHFLRPDLLGITGPPDPRVNGTGTHTDFRNPAILIYEPRPDGSLQLVAVENLVFAAAWRQAGNPQPPSFHGLAYDHMIDDPATPHDEAHGFAEHYDRHIWLYRENPRGIFAMMNPDVSCRHHTGHMSH
jgi:hypothetical protein